MTTQPPGPERIDRLANSVPPALAMLAGMQLDLFTPLKDGPKTAEQIADALGVGPAKLKPLLYALAAAELLTLEDAHFSNTPESDQFLVSDRSTYIGHRHANYFDQWETLLKTTESIRTGVPQARREFSSLSQEEVEAFVKRAHPRSMAVGRDLASRYDFSEYRHLLDAGGGTGGLSITMLQAYPQLHATVVDQSSITAATQRLALETGLSDRVQVVTADVVKDPLPGTFDVGVMSAFLQVLTPDEARQAVLNVGNVIKPGGTIFILGQGGILDNNRLSPPAAVAFNLTHVNRSNRGGCHTEQEHRDWLTEAGFVDIARANAPYRQGIITATKRN